MKNTAVQTTASIVPIKSRHHFLRVQAYGLTITATAVAQEVCEEEGKKGESRADERGLQALWVMNQASPAKSSLPSLTDTLKHAN